MPTNISFLYNPNKGGGTNARIASHSIGLSVLVFSTINHDLIPTTILILIQISTVCSIIGRKHPSWL